MLADVCGEIPQDEKTAQNSRKDKPQDKEIVKNEERSHEKTKVKSVVKDLKDESIASTRKRRHGASRMGRAIKRPKKMDL